MKKQIDKIIKANNLIEELKSAILGNVIVKIKDYDTHELLWSCHTDTCYGAFKKFEGKLEIEQDINLYPVLEAMKNIIENQNSEKE